MNKENLAKLRDKLITVGEQAFSMRSYRNYENAPAVKENPDYYSGVEDVNDPPCGTVACALGWAPSCGGDMKMTEEESNTTYWEGYSKRAFDILILSRLWDFLFSGAWTSVDDTPVGAARRIQYVLDGGELPKSFNKEVYEKTIIEFGGLDE